MKDNFVIGVDYGTDSVRSIIVNAATGEEISAAVYVYPRWRDALFCNPDANQFRQHPLDYLEGLEHTIKKCMAAAGNNIAASIRAISVDTTGSTPVAVDATGTPLSLLPGFENNPNAMFVLWKDHTAVAEAAELNTHAKKFSVNYLQYVGGVYSSEWYWAKLLHVLRADTEVRTAIHSWVEHCDWIPFVLTGGSKASEMKRSVCAAGHKALWAPEFGGLPPEEFFASWDPLLQGFRQKLFSQTYTADQPAGIISVAWATRLGLPHDVVIGVGAFDAHMGAVGGQIESYHLSKVMGTSTCDMLVAPIEEVGDTLVHGICGQVPGSVIPGMMGMEAGQSAFGDAYAWLKKLLLWPIEHIINQPGILSVEQAGQLRSALNDQVLDALTTAASQLPFESDDELATDWLNGRRTPDADQTLKATLTGLNLATNAPQLFKALVESTCFGAKKIVDRFNEQGVPVKGLIGLGGVARKSPYIMQVMADVMNMPIRIHRSEQTCALGAAMFAATSAGIYQKVEDAMQAMGQGFDKEYYPDKKKSNYYNRRYEQYGRLGNFTEDARLAIDTSTTV